jgi:hypothetical protein
MTADEADRALLQRANDNRKFAIPVAPWEDSELQEAFERGLDNEWFTLVDVSPIEIMPRTVFRIFRLTPAGLLRLAELTGEWRH